MKSKTRYLLSFVLIFLSAAFPLGAQMKIGVNSNNTTDYDTMIPFGEIFTNSREFHVGRNIDWSGLARDDSRISLDANGYPTRIDSSTPKVETLMLRDIQFGQYPTGTYTVVLEGSGRVELGLDATSGNGGSPYIFDAPGTYQFNVNSTSRNGISLAILRSDPGNHIRKIKVYLPGLQPGYKEEPWNPDYIDYLSDFASFRFMNSMNINGNRVVRWEDRTKTSYQTQSVKGGLAWEYQIKLINLLPNVSGWFHIPFFADDNYVRQAARLLRDNLVHKDKPIYVESGNEVWNDNLGGAHRTFWGENYNNDGNYGSVWTAWAQLYIDDYEILIDEFGSQRSRLRTVMGAQQASDDPKYGKSAQVFNHLKSQNADVIDVISPSGYLHNINYEIDCSTPAQVYAQKYVDDIRNGMTNRINNFFEIKAKMEAYFGRSNMEISFYEGGQHTLGFGDSCLIDKIKQAHESPEVAAAYHELMTRMNDLGVELFVLYRDGNNQNKLPDNQFGHQDYLHQPLEELKRLQAVLSFIDATYPNRNYYGQSETSNDPVCLGDVNSDGIFDNADVGAFLSLFLAGDPSVDFNTDGVLDMGDIRMFTDSCDARNALR